MPQIFQQGSLNTTALVVPDLYVQIVPPQNLLINGVPSNVVGMVGTATWGPVGQPLTVGSMAQYASLFGPIMARKFDLGTQVATAVQQGANAFKCVRVSDGTDAAATVTILSTCLTVTALYTGSLGNQITVTSQPGSRQGTLKLVVGIPGLTPESFDNIGAGPQLAVAAATTASATVTVAGITSGLSAGMAVFGPGVTGSPTISAVSGNTLTLSSTQTLAAGAQLTFAASGNALWLAAASAINTGINATRGPSALVSALAGAGTTAPASAVYSLAGGSDGVATITASVLVGLDTVPRKGMYALRGQGCGVTVLADADDNTQWANQVAFGMSEGTYMILVGPAGDTIANAVSVKAAAGIDTYVAKMMLGDWVYWADTVNNQIRLVSPQGFIAGRLGNLDPSQSSLNKPIYGVVGTQKTGLAAAQVTTYAVADLQVLAQAGIDVITNPAPGGNYFAARIGHNTSSNASIQGDNYTRMTNYVSQSLAGGMGSYIGQVISPSLVRRVKGTLVSFLMNLVGQNLLPRLLDGTLPFSVVCDLSNNPDSRTGLGYLQADIQVRYGSIAEKLLVNMEGGQTVSVVRQSSTISTGT